MTQLDLFYEDPPRNRTLKATEIRLTLGDLIDVNGEIFEIDSVQRFCEVGFPIHWEYTYRPYGGPL